MALTVRQRESVLPAHMSILEGRHVLVVEGNALNREILVTQLTRRGMECLAVENAIAALTALNAGYEWDRMFDLVILDMDMPGMDGANLARGIKTDTRYAHMPLVMLTSMGRPGEARKCEAIGFAAYLSKPVRQSELFDTLALVLHQMESPYRAKDIVTRHVVRESELSHVRQEQFAGHVLVAEDNPVNQQVAVGILGKFGLSADVAADGAKALHCLEQNRYDLVLMDVHMPGMDGLAATREIRRLKSGNARIPIIAMTAGAMPQDRKQCREAGMDDYIAKPVNPALLARVLGSWLPGLRTASLEVADAPPEQNIDVCVPVQELPVFDARELRRRCMGDQELVRDVLNIFQGSLAERLETLRQAMDREDRPGLVQIAHAVKGSAINVACPALAQAAAELEQACQALDSPIDPKLVENVEQEVARVVQIIWPDT